MTNFIANEFEEVIIGRGITSGAAAQEYRAKEISVYLNNEFMGTVPLGALRRFSKFASRHIPAKPTKTKARPVLEVRTYATLSTPPPASAVTNALLWMRQAGSCKDSTTWPNYCRTPFSKTNLMDLVDHMAAAVSLEMRPWPVAVEKVLCSRLYWQHPTAAEVIYVCDHLPVKCRLVTKALQSFVFYKIEQDRYSEDEASAVEGHVCQNVTLATDLDNIYREYRRRS